MAPRTRMCPDRAFVSGSRNNTVTEYMHFLKHGVVCPLLRTASSTALNAPTGLLNWFHYRIVHQQIACDSYDGYGLLSGLRRLLHSANTTMPDAIASCNSSAATRSSPDEAHCMPCCFPPGSNRTSIPSPAQFSENLGLSADTAQQKPTAAGLTWSRPRASARPGWRR